MTPKIPRMGYGTWRRSGNEAYSCVRDALEIGYRHIDTAAMYGNEREVGKAIRDSGIKRSDIFLTSKVGPENFGPGQVLRHAKASLDRLGVDRMDLFLLHWPSEHFNADDYVAQLGEVQDKGLATQIGVSNFTKTYLDVALRVLGASRIATNQVEVHVLMQNRPIVEYCRAHNISVTCYCPLARGHLSGHAGIAEIATKHGAAPEQIGVAFLLAEGLIVIPSSSKRERIQSNWEAQKIQLSADEIAALRKMDQGQRLVSGGWAPAWDR